MTAILTLQPVAQIDNVWPDGAGGIVVGERLPYPWHVTEAGEVLRQDVWRGSPARVLGFVRDPEVRAIDLRWAEAWASPESTRDLYPVMVDSAGTWSTWLVSIDDATRGEL